MTKARNIANIASDGSALADGTINYTDVSGTPTLATVATTGAYADVTGTPTLATVATSGAYADVTGTPAAALPLTGGTLSGGLNVSSGNVGIGTVSPTTKLQSKGGSIATLTDNAGLIANASASFVVDHGNDYGLYTGYIAAAGDAIGIAATRTLGSALPLSLQPFGGNVGIGTTSPSFEGGTGTGLEINNSSGNGAHVKLTDAASGSGGTNGFDLYAFNTSGYIENYEAGSIVFRNGGTERMRIKSTGDIQIGTDIAGANLLSIFGVSNSKNGICIMNSADSSPVYSIFFNNAAGGLIGSITNNGSSVAYNTSSDYRLKEDLQLMSGASERVLALKPINFAWISTGERVDGFLAHELAEVIPEAVVGTKDGMRDEQYEVTAAVLDDNGMVVTEAVMGTRSVPDYQGIDQSKLVPLLTAALQEALNKIASMETRLAALEAV